MTKKRKVTSKLSPTSQGTAVLGEVVSELVICGVFNVTDAEALYLAKGLSTAMLARFNMELLEASGYLEKNGQ